MESLNIGIRKQKSMETTAIWQNEEKKTLHPAMLSKHIIVIWLEYFELIPDSWEVRESLAAWSGAKTKKISTANYVGSNSTKWHQKVHTGSMNSYLKK